MAFDQNKVTLLFRDGVYAISESHWTVGAEELAVTVPKMKKLAIARYKLMGAGVQIIGARVSKEGVFRDSLMLGPDDLAIPVRGTNADKLDNGEGSTGDPDQAKACPLIRAEGGTQHRKSIYLSGVPDDVIRGNPPVLNFGGVPGFQLKFDAYAKELITKGWGFAVVDQVVAAATKKAVLACVTQAVTGLLGIVTSGTITGAVIGTKLQLRNFKMKNPAYKSPNGRQVIGQIEEGPGAGQFTYWLLNSAGILPANIFLFGSAERVEYTVQAYTELIPRNPTTRKRGNRSLAGPGRRSTRKLLLA